MTLPRGVHSTTTPGAPAARLLICRINLIFIPKTVTTKSAWIKAFLEILVNLHIMMPLGFGRTIDLISTNHCKLNKVFPVAFSDIVMNNVYKDKNVP